MSNPDQLLDGYPYQVRVGREPFGETVCEFTPSLQDRGVISSLGVTCVEQITRAHYDQDGLKELRYARSNRGCEEIGADVVQVISDFGSEFKARLVD